MEFTEVKNAHIVPRCYLKNFAVKDAVMLRVDDKPPVGPISIDDAGVRQRFYRRFRPDGTPIYDIEWSLSVLEDAVGPLLPHVREGWPIPCIEIKAALAEFFAYQFVRGPRWKKWREEVAREAADEFRRNPEPVLHNGIWIPASQRQINYTEDKLLSETEWLTRMMVIANRLITAFGSMRWHLIEFAEPLLAISDHPVVAWPIESQWRRPEATPAGLGVRNFLEVRAPISPTLGLLMTWQESPDHVQIFQGSEELAANLNAFTIANADRQWMYMPGTEVPIADGFLDPVSKELITGYGASEVERSEVREQVTELLVRKQGQDIHEAVDENGRMHAEIVWAEEQTRTPGETWSTPDLVPAVAR
jgi:Protein of unknown function (DUF4238)